MSNIIIPKPNELVRQQEFKLPQIDIPPQLQEDFRMNPHLEPRFYATIAQTLNVTLNDPRTRLRVITESALRERVELCYKTIAILRYDMNYSLRKCLDLLPTRITEAIARGERPEDVAERTEQGNAWAGPGGKRAVQADRRQLVADTFEEEMLDDDDG